MKIQTVGENRAAMIEDCRKAMHLRLAKWEQTRNKADYLTFLRWQQRYDALVSGEATE